MPKSPLFELKAARKIILNESRTPINVLAASDMIVNLNALNSISLTTLEKPMKVSDTETTFTTVIYLNYGNEPTLVTFKEDTLKKYKHLKDALEANQEEQRKFAMSDQYSTAITKRIDDRLNNIESSLEKTLARLDDKLSSKINIVLEQIENNGTRAMTDAIIEIHQEGKKSIEATREAFSRLEDKVMSFNQILEEYDVSD